MRFIAPLIITLLLAFPAQAAQKTLTFASIDSKAGRAAMRVLKQAYGKLGIRVQAKYLPVARAHVEAETGILDGETIRIEGAEIVAPELIRIPVPLFTASVAAYTCRNDIAISDWGDLKQYSIGIRSGINYIERLTIDFPMVTRRITPDQLFDQLAQDRLDVVIANPKEGARYLKANPDTCIRMAAPQLGEFHLYHYLNRKHANIAQAVERSMREMQSKGDIDRLLREADPK